MALVKFLKTENFTDNVSEFQGLRWTGIDANSHTFSFTISGSVTVFNLKSLNFRQLLTFTCSSISSTYRVLTSGFQLPQVA